MPATLNKPSVYVKHHQKDDIINRLALKEPQRKIAKDHNITQSCVSLIKKRNEDRVLQVQQELISDNLDNIRDSIRIDVENNKSLSNEFKDSSNITSDKVSLKTSTQKNIIKPLLEKVGIFNTNTMQAHFGDTNIQNNIVTPDYQSFLDFQSQDSGAKQAETVPDSLQNGASNKDNAPC